ncbi:MAG: lactate racemase domain-containing protein [Gaiellales bacterium]
MRLPLLAGSRALVASLPDDAVVIRVRPPVDALTDVGAAVREALRYPLSGDPLDRLATRDGKATVVVEPPVLPLPGAPLDPRRIALAAILDELASLGVAPDDQTILVAGGLERRPRREDLDWLLPPAKARDYRGEVVVHDCEAEELVRLETSLPIATRVHPALVQSDLVITLSAAESVLHGGPAVLAGACGPAVARSLEAESLLEPRSAPGWALVGAVEEAIAARTPLIAVSLLLDPPRVARPFAGPVGRRVLNALPEASRRRVLEAPRRELGAIAAFAGPPAVAHAEALVRGTALRAVEVREQLETLVVPIPWFDAHHPREAPNPITAAAIGLGLAMRLWRDRPPLVPGGTVVLVHPLSRTIGHGPQAPYRAVLGALRDGQQTGRLAHAEALAARDRKAIAAYRAGKAPHPRLPFQDWASCAPAIAHAGRVIVAGCRDAAVARALGFVPSHNLATAIEMAIGVAGGGRVGVLDAPPYVPLVPG